MAYVDQYIRSLSCSKRFQNKFCNFKILRPACAKEDKLICFHDIVSNMTEQMCKILTVAGIHFYLIMLIKCTKLLLNIPVSFLRLKSYLILKPISSRPKTC
ncbi:hypothetical protein MXB_5023 [Myxobolus squamalis]|nr:hypothetical protein MXB_5023 [Myxobolus squamalis]